MLRAALAAALLFPSVALATGYDDSWYEADLWSGEYPTGFAVTADTTVKIRAEPATEAEQTFDCALKKNAVYHPWNAARVASDKLTFKSFTRKVGYTLNGPLTVTLTRNSDTTDVELKLAKGEPWTFLEYFAEGAFLLEYKGEKYIGYQDLIEASTEPATDESGYREWLGLTCANGAAGWIYLPEIKATAGIGEPVIENYGEAADLAP